ncbi:type VI secretion system tip protein VgrG [Pelagibaculum spongiae]|uniref:Type VI secretion system tip protein VgrG n=2 Tax=Pelagibaculum spongiae TaxID=2080658 RepID=A0A2V1H707_9GAMM|nr:type VI secretion system tip protein VgrG [Pelagibaculum spongiae]
MAAKFANADSARGLQFTLTCSELADDVFSVVSFDAEEKLSAPYCWNISLASRDHAISANNVVDLPVSLMIWRNGQLQRKVSGIVSYFSKQGAGLQHSFYKLTLVAPFYRLSLRTNCRIFQQLTARQVIEILLKEMAIEDYVFELKDFHQKREYCVQYRESDLDFINRITAEEGIFYYFSADSQQLIFSDCSQTSPELEPCLFNNQSSGNGSQPSIQRFEQGFQIAQTDTELSDYSFKQPYAQLFAESLADNASYQNKNYQHFNYPGRFKDRASGKAFTQYRMQALRNRARLAYGFSDIADLHCGGQFSLIAHSVIEVDQKWLVVEVSHHGNQAQSLEESAANGSTDYQCNFTVSEGQQSWRPDPAKAPLVDGPQIARVVGPKNEEIYCDQYGRVKVQFPWDRYGASNEQSSCWVRVAQGWAGAGFGILAIPRIGHEVIVDFLEGDPDQPIITGRTYHAVNTPPYPLPANKTKTVIKTRTHKGRGFNELSFEDRAQHERIYLHAEKDYDLDINHDQQTTVGNDRTKFVGNDQKELIKQDEIVSIGRNRDETIENDLTLRVNRDYKTRIKRHYQIEVQDQRLDVCHASQQQKIKGDFTELVEGKTHHKSGQSLLLQSKTITMTATDKLIIQGPGGKITIDSAGVTVDSPQIKLNGQVAVSTGSASKLEALKSAAETGTPIVENCLDCQS